MNDDLAVAHATRAGSRVASASGNDLYADYGIIQTIKPGGRRPPAAARSSGSWSTSPPPRARAPPPPARPAVVDRDRGRHVGACNVYTAGRPRRSPRPTSGASPPSSSTSTGARPSGTCPRRRHRLRRGLDAGPPPVRHPDLRHGGDLHRPVDDPPRAEGEGMIRHRARPGADRPAEPTSGVRSWSSSPSSPCCCSPCWPAPSTSAWPGDRASRSTRGPAPAPGSDPACGSDVNADFSLMSSLRATLDSGGDLDRPPAGRHLPGRHRRGQRADGVHDRRTAAASATCSPVTRCGPCRRRPRGAINTTTGCITSSLRCGWSPASRIDVQHRRRVPRRLDRGPARHDRSASSAPPRRSNATP